VDFPIATFDAGTATNLGWVDEAKDAPMALPLVRERIESRDHSAMLVMSSASVLIDAAV
jgi:hypothetical protein